MPGEGLRSRIVGARGIKRRKPKHELHDFTDDLTPGDEQRLFGRFRWGNYSPAGNLERNGFFWRQLSRGGHDHAGRDALQFMLYALPFVLAFVAVMMLLAFMFHHA